MTGKYIHLTKRNIAKINQLFDQLALKTIVGAQVASEPLSSAAFRKLAAQNNRKQSLREKESNNYSLETAAGLKVHALRDLVECDEQLNLRLRVAVFTDMDLAHSWLFTHSY